MEHHKEECSIKKILKLFIRDISQYMARGIDVKATLYPVENIE
jgi:hypothetical protein